MVALEAMRDVWYGGWKAVCLGPGKARVGVEVARVRLMTERKARYVAVLLAIAWVVV